MNKRAERIFMTIMFAIALVGGASIIRQMMLGMSITNLREPVVWGLYVVGFAYFLGIGSCALAVSGITIAWGGRDLEQFARMAASVALAALVAAGLFITMDLGRPDRAWMLMAYPMPESPLTWDFFILNGLLILSAIPVFIMLHRRVHTTPVSSRNILYKFIGGTKQEEDTDMPVIARKLARIVAVAAPILYLLTTRVFVSLRARPDWNSTGLGLTFLVSAILSGLAAVIVATSLFFPDGFEEGGERLKKILLRSMLGLVIIDLLISLAPAITMLQWGSPTRTEAVHHFSPTVIVELIIGLAIPLLILLFNTKAISRCKLSFASLLILVGGALKRWNIIIPAMEHRNLPLADATYHPNTHEWLVSVGIIAITTIVLYVMVRLGDRWLPKNSKI